MSAFPGFLVEKEKSSRKDAKKSERWKLTLEALRGKNKNLPQSAAFGHNQIAKHKIRNPKQIQNRKSKYQNNPSLRREAWFLFWNFGFQTFEFV